MSSSDIGGVPPLAFIKQLRLAGVLRISAPGSIGFFLVFRPLCLEQVQRIRDGCGGCEHGLREGVVGGALPSRLALFQQALFQHFHFPWIGL